MRVGAVDIGTNTARLLIPLAFASLLGGMLTLIGTPPNIVVSNQLRAQGLEPFRFFTFAPVGLVMLACKSHVLGAAKRVLAAVGQMALTNYLMQTIICTTIFYGHGFGRFGHFERTEQILTVLGVWVVQLIWSPIWMRRFRFGPFEWLWRSLTYLKPQPMRR